LPIADLLLPIFCNRQLAIGNRQCVTLTLVA
jgi:hypothetical protein